MLIDVVILLLKVVAVLFLSNFMMKFQLFFNYYTIVAFCFLVLLLGVSACGLKETLSFILKSLAPSWDTEILKSTIDSFYRFSYVSGIAITLSGLIIILSDLERMIGNDNNVYEAFAINLLPLLYSIIYAEFFCKPLKIKFYDKES